MAGKGKELRAESPTDNFPKQYYFQLYSEYLFM